MKRGVLKMKVIDKGNYETFMEKGVLEIGGNTKVQLKNTHNIKIIAEDKNEIECGNNCDIICGNYCNITCGDYCNIKFISDNIIKTGKSCKIEGEIFNEIEVEDNSDITVYDEGKITLRGRNIILEILNEGASNMVNNFSNDSIILTYDKKGWMKIYKTNELIDGEIIPIVNGKIGKEYKVKY